MRHCTQKEEDDMMVQKKHNMGCSILLINKLIVDV
jgi:hypothetical protein